MTVPERPCPCCNIVRQNPTYPQFNLGCVYCGARLIQRLGQMQISATECKVRRQAVLRDWVEFGHCEQQIRTLVAGPPCIGPARAPESERQSSAKTR